MAWPRPIRSGVWPTCRGTIHDEVPHVPPLFSSPDVAIDRQRMPGRFMSTRPAHVLLLPTLAIRWRGAWLDRAGVAGSRAPVIYP